MQEHSFSITLMQPACCQVFAICVRLADEHYVPTLLAYLGKDQETDCWGFLVNVDWSRGGAHPRTYSTQDIDVSRCAFLQNHQDYQIYHMAALHVWQYHTQNIPPAATTYHI